MSSTNELAIGQNWQAKVGNYKVRHIQDVGDETVVYTEGQKNPLQYEVSLSVFHAWREENQAELVTAAPAARLSPGLELGSRIRLLREMAGMSQLQLAEATGISRSAVTFWETGRSGHVGKHLARLAEVLGVEPEVLLTGMAHQEIPVVVTMDENIILELYRQLDPLTKLQTQKWIERRVREAEAK